jgi:hypothetical protein
MSDPVGQTSTETDVTKKGILRFYRNKRSFFSLIVGMGVTFITTNPFIGFVAYVLSVLFWDFVFFTQEGQKDSTRAPESYFTSMGITPQQMDQFNTYMAKVRRAAFAISILFCTASLLFFPKVDFQVVFVATYLGFNLGMMIFAYKQRKIIWPYGSDESAPRKPGYPPMLMVSKAHYDPSSDNPMVNPFYSSVKKPKSYND